MSEGTSGSIAVESRDSNSAASLSSMDCRTAFVSSSITSIFDAVSSLRSAFAKCFPRHTPPNLNCPGVDLRQAAWCRSHRTWEQYRAS